MTGLRLTLARKLPLLISGAALVTALTVGSISFFKASEALEERGINKLQAVVAVKGNAMLSYLTTLQGALDSAARNPFVISSISDLTSSWDMLGKDQTQVLQKLYIEENPNAADQRALLDNPDDGSLYSIMHGENHPWFRDYVVNNGFHDLYLINKSGAVIYSVAKQGDFGTFGEGLDPQLAKIVSNFETEANLTSSYFLDFVSYAPSGGQPIAFLASPIFDRQGAYAGVLAVALSVQQINSVMQEATGMGETGETFLVGSDFLMRSDSRFSTESTILSKKVESEYVTAALDGQTGTFLGKDVDGYDVALAYLPLNFSGINWALVGKMREGELLAPVVAMRNQAALISLAALVVITLLGFAMTRGIGRSIRGMTDAMQQLAAGDRSVEIPGQGRGDEIGLMAEAVEVFKTQGKEAEDLRTAQEEERQRASEERAAMRTKLSGDFETEVGQVVQAVTASTDQLRSRSEQLLSTAETAGQQSNAVSSATDLANQSVQTVASSAEELSASISEVTQKVEEVSDLANDANSKADNTNQTMKTLAEAADKVGSVVDLISEIAEQTNLLALNATIEAARAGEAGKGFAVVASEVKSLATQTAKATAEISEQISSMQAISGEAVTAIGEIQKVVQGVNEIASAVAAAVEEQNAATAEIARSAQEASSGTQNVATSISSVREGASDTRNAAQEMQTATGSLLGQADQLNAAVHEFVEKLRAV
ncbi:methyl-accepting chemotaxis protein [Rhodovibrionaceae bacterium A322]